MAKDQDVVVERLMQLEKSQIANRVARNAEITLALNHLTMRQVRVVLQGQYGRLQQLMLQVGLLPPPSRKELAGIHDGPNHAGATNTHHLVGAGKYANAAQVERLQRAMATLYHRPGKVKNSAWSQLPLSEATKHLDKAITFNSAWCAPFDIACHGTGKAKTTANYFVQVRDPA